MVSNCANCEISLVPGNQFCGSCGQKAHLHRLSWHDITHDVVHYFTHADKGIFHLLTQLITKTGTVAREFVSGKRKKYFPPLNFFLIVAAIYVFLFTLTTKPSSTIDVLKEHPELARIPNAQKRAQVTHIYERAGKARVFMNKHSNGIAMLALPLLAGIFWLFYRKAGYNYVEHLVANMYMTGFALLCHVLVFLPIGLILNLANPNIILVAFFIFQLVYCSVFYYRFINKISGAARVKAFFVSLFGIFSWALLTGSLIRLYITNGFWGLLT